MLRHFRAAPARPGSARNSAGRPRQSRAIRANGLSNRRLRARRRCTAAGSRASTARWKPPMPLMARMAPASSSARAAATWSRSARPETSPVAASSSSCGPHTGTGIGLGVETPIAGIVVFRLAGPAHREGRHTGAGAIVGDGAHDREPGAAMGAVGEGVAIASAGRIADLGEAGGAGGGIGDHAGPDRARAAGQDAKARRRRRPGQGLRLQAVDARERRRLGLQAPEEAPARSRRTPDPDQHALGVVPDLAAQAAVGRQPPGVGPKAHALNEAAHANRLARHPGRRRSGLRPALESGCNRQSRSPRPAHMLRIR